MYYSILNTTDWQKKNYYDKMQKCDEDDEMRRNSIRHDTQRRREMEVDIPSSSSSSSGVPRLRLASNVIPSVRIRIRALEYGEFHGKKLCIHRAGMKKREDDVMWMWGYIHAISKYENSV